MEKGARYSLNFEETQRTIADYPPPPLLARPMPLHPGALSPFHLPLGPLPLMSGCRSPFTHFTLPTGHLHTSNFLQSMLPPATITQPEKVTPKSFESAKMDQMQSINHEVPDVSPMKRTMPLSPMDFPWIYHPYHQDFFR